MSRLATVFSAELEGVDARVVEVEIDLHVGLHAFNIVGLADRALNEARERVNSALKNSGAKPPNRENRKITVNLAPAGLPKTGSRYDFAIAVGYLSATSQIPRFSSHDKIFLGELALDGRLRPVAGALNVAEMAVRKKFRFLFLPLANADQASAIRGVTVIAIERLQEAIDVLAGHAPIVAHRPRMPSPRWSSTPDISEVHGQENAKRALLIAASGQHNLLMIGSPGIGKTTLARALPSMLPPPSHEEVVEITKVWSAAGAVLTGLVTERPFRAPHHTTPSTAMFGGGAFPRPGEISLAHRGVLFLDELSEFPARTLDALRDPLEHGTICVSRMRRTIRFPCRFSLVAAMNPCPCGFFGDEDGRCACAPYALLRHRKKISGPFLDRVDLHLKMLRPSIRNLRSAHNGEGSSAARKRASIARAIQHARFKGLRPGLRANADMSPTETEKLANLSPAALKFLATLERRGASPRAYYRALKVARTIADLEQREAVEPCDLAEAWGYRIKENTQAQ